MNIINKMNDLEIAAPLAIANFAKSKTALDNVVKSYLFHYFQTGDVRPLNGLIDMLCDARCFSRYKSILIKLVCHELGQRRFIGQKVASKFNSMFDVNEKTQQSRWSEDFDQMIEKLNTAQLVDKAGDSDPKTFDGEVEKFIKRIKSSIERLSEFASTKADKQELKRLKSVLASLESAPQLKAAA